MTIVNARGFSTYAAFEDRYKSQVRVQQSSLATEPCVWIFVDSDLPGYSATNPPAAHLTVEQAAVVRDALSEFIKENS